MTRRKTKARSREREALQELMDETRTSVETGPNCGWDFYPFVSRAQVRERAAEIRRRELGPDEAPPLTPELLRQARPAREVLADLELLGAVIPGDNLDGTHLSPAGQAKLMAAWRRR